MNTNKEIEFELEFYLEIMLLEGKQKPVRIITDIDPNIFLSDNWDFNFLDSFPHLKVFKILLSKNINKSRVNASPRCA